MSSPVEIGDLRLRARRRSRRPAPLPAPRRPRLRSSSGLPLKPCSSTLATYIVGFIVSRNSGFEHRVLLGDRDRRERAGCASFSAACDFLSAATSRFASLSPPARAAFPYRLICLSTVARSASASSVLIVSMSETGSTLPATCTTLSIVEAAHDVRDGVGLADVGEKLVAQAFAFRGAGDQPGDVDEFDDGGNDLLGTSRSRQAPPAAGRGLRRCRRWARSCRTDNFPPRCRPWSAR